MEIFVFLVSFVLSVFYGYSESADKAEQSKAQFSEVIQSTSALKYQVELCIRELGFQNIKHCSNGNKGIVFDLSRESHDYESKYVEYIDVNEGKISAKAKFWGNLKGETFILFPRLDNNDTNDNISWFVSVDSTCLMAGVC